MEPESQRSVDVSGLSEEAVRAVESVVSAIRGKSEAGPDAYPSREEWAKALRDWAASHERVDHFVDDSRESIYAGRGE